jgi:hypothetical protein
MSATAWFAKIGPANTSNNLFPVIVNEMDSSDWFMNDIAMPALAVICAMLLGRPETSQQYLICAAPGNPSVPD